MKDRPSRFSQAQILIAALFAVVLTGEMPKGQRAGLSASERALLKKGQVCFGAIKAAAGRIGLSQNYVGKVATGVYTSEPVLAAVRKEMQAMKDRAAGLAPLSPEELSGFAYGGRYYGIQSVVARRLNLVPHQISHAARRPNFRPERFIALREEMRRIDAELAVKP
jgi:hypothetical protein